MKLILVIAWIVGIVLWPWAVMLGLKLGEFISWLVRILKSKGRGGKEWSS